MDTTINYIYNPNGIAEYAVIPIEIWENLKSYLPKTKNLGEKVNMKIKEENKEFNPEEYIGLTSHLNLDVEAELKEIREGWDKRLL